MPLSLARRFGNSGRNLDTDPGKILMNLRGMLQSLLRHSASPKSRHPADCYQAAYYPDTGGYYFGYNSLPRVSISGAPDDADDSRWTMLHDGEAYHLYMFKQNSTDTIYQFVWNGESYELGYHDAIPELRLTNVPADADTSSFAMLYGELGYHLYIRRRSNPTVLYQFVWSYESLSYDFGEPDVYPELHIKGFPADTDWSRWSMLHDGDFYRFYAFKLGSNTEIYQGAWDGEHYTFGYASEPILSLHDAPSNTDFSSFSLLYDDEDYRLYMKVK